MQEIARSEPEEQELRSRTPKHEDTTIDGSLETMDGEFNDDDGLKDDEEISYRFSRRENMRIRWGYLKPMFPTKKNNLEFKVVLGPDCRFHIT